MSAYEPSLRRAQSGPSTLPPERERAETETMDPVRTSPETLGHAECLDLLRTMGVGRLGYSQRALPAIATVSYGVAGQMLVLRVDADAPELPWLRNTVVAFQADRTDPEGHQAWTVSCVGHARPVTDAERIEALAEATRTAARPGPPAFLLLDPDQLVGRLFHELPLTGARALSDAAVRAS